MRAVFGLLLVMLGLAIAIVWMPEHDSQRQLAVVTDIATQGMPRRLEPGDRNGRTFSPNTPLIATVEPPRQPQPVADVARLVRTGAGGDAVARAIAAPPPAASTVTAAHSIMPATVVAQSALDGSAATRPAPLSEASRYELVRNLQRELKRVGCYAGDVDGDWGAGSRRAMAAFTDRVNASLPVEQPDFILLTLVQGHQSGICGKGCPAGMTPDNGRCVSGAVVAQHRRPQDRRNPALSNDVVQYTTTQTATAPAAQDTGWSTQVVRSGTGTAAPPSSIAPAAIAVAVAAAVAPLPGRMSIRGPETGLPSGSPSDRSLARAAVRLESPQPADNGAVRPIQGAEKRDRARRTARGGGSYRSSPFGYRAPRIASPTYYASAPRRSRSWTGTFFGFP